MSCFLSDLGGRFFQDLTDIMNQNDFVGGFGGWGGGF